MKLSDFISSLPYGGQAAFAERLGIAPAYLHQMLHGIRPIPIRRVFDISRATDWQVTPNDLRPDIYPHPEDGLPVDLRGGARAPENAA